MRSNCSSPRRFGSPRLLAALAATICLWALPAEAQRSLEPDEAPSLSSFALDLSRNANGLWSRDNLLPLIVGVSAAAAARPADGAVTAFFRNGDRWQGFDPIGRRFGRSQILGPIVGVSLVTSRFTGNERYQRFTYELAQGFVLTNAVTAGIKVAAGRERPDQASRYSFPSGHTSNSFMWATVVSRTYGWKAGAPAYAFASYVGASRLKSRKHFLSDVVAGATLGYIVGRTVTHDRRRDAERRFPVSVRVPAGGGVALNFGIRLGRR